MKLSRNDTVLLSCVAGVAAMVGLSYAAVPLYYAFCRATGYAGTPNRADRAPGEIDNRIITVRFDTNVDPALPWSFQPETRTVQVHVGENKLVFFRAKNEDTLTVTGHASFNVQPDNAAVYFTKIQCFCFNEQKLQPGETVEMPVSFFIDPAIMKDRNADGVTEITLSYTFFPSVNQATEISPPVYGGSALPRASHAIELLRVKRAGAGEGGSQHSVIGSPLRLARYRSLTTSPVNGGGNLNP